jgi:multimeric flavodoxin WrbA
VLAGFETEELHLCDQSVLPIADCHACVESGRCDLEDEFEGVMQQLYAADLLVLGTPLYWYGPSGQLKQFLDRWSCLLDREEERFRSRMRGKRTVIVVAQGERGFYEVGPCLQMIEWSLLYLAMPVVGRIVVVGHARGDYAGDSDQRAAVSDTARRIAHAEPTDLLPPWFHVSHEPGTRLGGVFTP